MGASLTGDNCKVGSSVTGGHSNMDPFSPM